MKSTSLGLLLVLTASCPQLAAASEWGCEVLLCAASSSPGWHGVAECHPPMERLISAMTQPGFAWPTCPEGGTGEPGHEEFEECPAGWSAAPGELQRDGLSRQKLSRCSREVNKCRGRVNFDGNGNCRFTEFMARPRREQPYFFDLADPSTRETTRFYFSLGR